MVQQVIVVTKIASMVVLVSSFLFNSIGIYFLYKTRRSSSHQQLLIMNLSITEIIISIGFISQDAVTITGQTYDQYIQKPFSHVIWACRSGTYCVWYFFMYFIALDRFIACNFPLQHHVLASRRNLKTVIVIIWIICFANTIVLNLNFQLFYSLYTTYIWLILDGIFLIITIATYASIFTKKKQNMRINVASGAFGIPRRLRQLNRNQQFFKVVGLIIISFVLFEIIPSTVFLIIFVITSSGSELKLAFILLSYDLVLLADPLIYIFLQDRIRRRLFRNLRIFKCNFKKKKLPNGCSLVNQSYCHNHAAHVQDTRL